MIEITKYCISQTATIREALSSINDISGSAQMLFVLNEQQQVVGALSDGDIRRGLIAGHELSESVEQIMFRNFRYFSEGNIDIEQLREYRQLKLSVVPVLDKDGRLLDLINLKKQKSLLPIDAVIMAGGKGERLRPLTLTTPKPLLPVGNKAIIDYNIDRLVQYGVQHISVTVNYLAEQIEEHYKELRSGVLVHCIREPKFLGTIGAVQFVQKFYNDTILVMNSDLFTDIDFEDMYLHFVENDADMSVAAIPYNVSVPYGIFDLEGRNIIGLQEKPVYNYYANAGIYLIKRSALGFIAENEFFNATDLIEKLVAEQKRVIRYPLKGTWIDIGTMSEYTKAQDIAKRLSL